MVSITDEIIDAIIQNENRHVCRPGRQRGPARAPQSTADLKPDWGQLPPDAQDAGWSLPDTQA
ncbi:MAG: hypothetical protein P4L36_08565 [Holophaga sp.]|nr:hypothetical protein [Holophaga sp.]